MTRSRLDPNRSCLIPRLVLTLPVLLSLTGYVWAQTPTASVSLSAPGPEPEPAEASHGPHTSEAAFQSGVWTCSGYAASPESWLTAYAYLELKVETTVVAAREFAANSGGAMYQVGGNVAPADSWRRITCSINVNVDSCGYCGSATDSASDNIPAQCGDGRDALIMEYKTNTIDLTPRCSDFSNDGPNEFNHSEDNTHQPWGIVKDVLFVKRAQIQEYALYTVRITSGYRCPHINAMTPGAAAQSRHMYGDAMDLTPPLDRWSPPSEAEFDRLHDAAAQTSPSYITDWTTYSDHHLHVDYR